MGHIGVIGAKVVSAIISGETQIDVKLDKGNWNIGGRVVDVEGKG